MKIVTTDEFMTYPKDTVYHEYGAIGQFGPLSIKGVTLQHDGENADWYFKELYGDLDIDDWNDEHEKYDQLKSNGEEFAFDFEIVSRDGMFDVDRMYAVYDVADIARLISKLSDGIKCIT